MKKEKVIKPKPQIFFISKEQYEEYQKGKLQYDQLCLYSNKGKEGDWVKEAWPPEKVEVKVTIEMKRSR